MDDELFQEQVYPLFAPLPLPIAKHLLSRFIEQYHFEQEEACAKLLSGIAIYRDVAFTYMNPFVEIRQREIAAGRADTFSTGWLLDTLTRHTPGKRPVSQQTLGDWSKRKLVRYEHHGLPDSDSAAALFIARMIDTRKVHWLPTAMDESEPLWWCWRQDTPTSPVIPCPYPLPTDLAPSTLLWTTWSGAAWHPDWVSVGNGVGAIRFVGIKKRGYTLRWNVSYDALQQWQGEMTRYPSPPILTSAKEIYNTKVEEMRQQMLHTLATQALQHLALTRFDAFRPFILKTSQE